ncbi:MAG: PQQ-binding-like beta-propeller repeat protein [Calditrichia bacterium]
MKRIALKSVVLLMLVGLILPATAKEDGSSKQEGWPQWRGAGQNGTSSVSGVFSNKSSFGLTTAWRQSIGQGYSSVSITPEQAITMYTDGTSDILASFDATTGKPKWQYKMGPMYVGQNGSHNGPSSTPLIDGNQVFGLERKGKLFALDAGSGKELWSRNLVEKDKAREPNHGFTTAPLVYDNVLIVEVGGTEGNTISGYNKETGELLWSGGNDQVDYHSPIFAEFGGQTQLIAAGRQYLYGLNPKTGEKLWEFHHQGNGGSINPVRASGDNLLVQASNREASLLEVKSYEGSFAVKELWKSSDIKRSFNVPIYHDGHFYSYSGRFLNCVNETTGETVWKSRPPGDGFVILVDDHLVILTKQGTLHIADASPKGYNEKANLKVFEDLAWSPPSFANGKIYARSLGEIAGIDISAASTSINIKEEKRAPVAPNSKFAGFVRTLTNAPDKEATINAFIKKQTSFPIIEGNDLVHFVYNGKVRDVVITGDMFDQNDDEPMIHVPGTDFYYYSTKLKPDAHLGYQFIRDYENRITDPLNPDTVGNFNGTESQFSMPAWKKPTFLGTAKKQGKIVEAEYASAIMGDTRQIKVYLPVGYESSSQKYPTLYITYGQMSIDFGKIPTALDNLIASGQIKPVVAVFIIPTRTRFAEYARQNKANHSRMLAEELVPFVDKTWRTTGKAADRLIMGGDEGGYVSFYTSFKHPGTFGMIAGQSSHLMSAEGQELREMVTTMPKQPVKIYMDWGSYDYRSVSGGYNWQQSNQEFAKLLTEKGYKPITQEYSSGFGWTSWRTRTDKILTTFFAK